jgi:hypothetical protein
LFMSIVIMTSLQRTRWHNIGAAAFLSQSHHSSHSSPVAARVPSAECRLVSITNECFKTKSPSFLLTSAVDEWRNTNSALGATIVSSSWQRLETRLGSIHEEQPHCIWNMSLSSPSSTGMVGAHHGPAWKCCCRVRIVCDRIRILLI